MLHVLITNVFLTNFLVAILTTVYNTMLEKGDFAFKTNLNKFIERYSIVMKDEWGYSELVVHAPPLNLFTFLLVPFVMKKEKMKKMSRLFSKFMYWFENMFYIGMMLGYEMVMLPIIFCQIMWNILRYASVEYKVPLAAFWLVAGILYLLVSVAKDMYYFVRTLSNFKNGEDKN